MLEVAGLSVARGQTQVLWDVALAVGGGETVALLGANGAGKSTLVETLCGLHRPLAGTIALAGESLAGRPAHEIARLGVACVPEGRRLFGEMTVLENLQLGAYPKRSRASQWRNLDRVFDLFPALRAKRDDSASSLSGGQQQMAAIGRALMSEPRLLLIDELSLGLSPKVTAELFEALDALTRGGLAVLLVEQNAALALRRADRAYVLESGRIALQGPAPALLKDDRVRRAYLGL